MRIDDSERQRRAGQLCEQAMQALAEENERLAQQGALDRCDKCHEPKQEHDLELALSNGIRLSLYSHHCQMGGPECTALVQSHLPSESAIVANRIVEWLVEKPELAALGVGWIASLHCEADQLILTYRVSVKEHVIAAVAAVPIQKFRGCAEN